MNMVTWEPVDEVPSKGMPRDERRWIGRTRGSHGRPWTRIVEDFLALECITARADYDIDDLTPDAVRSCLDSALRLGGSRFAGVRTLRRGDDIYLTRLGRTFRPDPDECRALIYEAMDGLVTLDLSDRTPMDREKIYRALHYHRTRLGAGDVRISMKKGSARLTLRPWDAPYNPRTGD